MPRATENCVVGVVGKKCAESLQKFQVDIQNLENNVCCAYTAFSLHVMQV